MLEIDRNNINIFIKKIVNYNKFESIDDNENDYWDVLGSLYYSADNDPCPWSIIENEDTITGFAIVDNFSMYDYLPKIIVVKKENIKWEN